MHEENSSEYPDVCQLPLAVLTILISYLPSETLQRCRRVCRKWNELFVQHMSFTVDLSDSALEILLKRPTLHYYELPVRHMIVHDMTPLSFSQLLSGGQDQLHLRISDNFKSVEKLTFFEGNTLEWKRKLLKSCRRIKEVYFSPHSYPVFPAGTEFSNLEKVDINLIKRSEGGELREFFQSAQFPALRRLKLGLCCRKDFHTYAYAHYFVARHYRSLKSLKLCVEILTGFGENSSEKFNLCPFNSDIESMCDETQRKLQASHEYVQYLDDLSKLSLEGLSVDFSPLEGRKPWTLTLEMLNSQKTLTKFRMQERTQDFSSNFQKLVLKNCKTIEKICAPMKITFDCSVLCHCERLRSFSVGESFNFIHPSSIPIDALCGNLLHFDQFPSSELLTTVCIGVPLSKSEIMWLSRHVPCSKFMVRGLPGDHFSRDEVALILQQRRNFKRLMMLIAIGPDQRHKLLTYFWGFRELIVLYFFDHISSGLTEFKVQITKFRLPPFKQLQDTLNRGDSDFELDPVFT